MEIQRKPRSYQYPSWRLPQPERRPNSNALGVLGWSEADIKAAVENPLRSGISYSPWWLVKAPAKQHLRALDEQGRANFVEELLPAVKAVVMSTGYAQAHDAFIKSRYNAVNHGLKSAEQPKTTAQALSTMEQLQKQVAAQMAQSFLSMPARGIEDAFRPGSPELEGAGG